MQNCDITNNHTSPHHPQANGLVERMNQTFKASLARGVNCAGNKWDRKLPLILLGIRAAHQATIIMPPYEALYGHRMRLPVIAEAFICNDTTDDQTNKPEDLEAQHLRAEHMQMIETQALRNIELAAERTVQSSLRRAEKRAAPLQPDIGDYVLVRNFTHGALQPTWNRNVFQCAGYNSTRTRMMVVEKGGKAVARERGALQTIHRIKRTRLKQAKI